MKIQLQTRRGRRRHREHKIPFIKKLHKAGSRSFVVYFFFLEHENMT